MVNQQQSITALGKAIHGLDRKPPDEIIREIEAPIQPMPESETALPERFGTPAELTGKYLEGEPTVALLGKWVARVGTKFRVVVGATVTGMVVTLTVLFHYRNHDALDLSNEKAAEQDSGLWDWHPVEGSSPMTVNVFQSQAVFYWHDHHPLRWRCN